MTSCNCGRSLFAKEVNFFSAVFSKQLYHQKAHNKQPQVKGNLFDSSQILTVASLTYKSKMLSANCLCLNTFFFQERFLYDYSIFF